MGLETDAKRKGMITEIILRLGKLEDSIRKILTGGGSGSSIGVIAAIYSTAAAQSIGNGTIDIVNFGTIVKDTNSAVTVGANWKFTAPTTGYYEVNAQILFTSTATWAVGEAGRLSIYINGALEVHIDRKDNYVTGSNYMQLSGSSVVFMTAGDFLDIRLNQNSGGALALFNDADFNQVSISSAGAAGATGPIGPTGATGPAGVNGTNGIVSSIVAGSNITVNSADPANPIVSSTGGGSGGADKYPFEARLTYETGVPLSTTDQTAKTTVFLTRYNGKQVALYDGSSAWANLDLGADISASLAGLGRSQAYTNDPVAGSNIVLNMVATAGFLVGDKVKVSSSAGSEEATITVVTLNTSITVDTLALNHTTTSPLVTGKLPYDIFVYNNSGSLALELLAWTDNLTRATALTTQDGVDVKSGATTRRYAGTLMTTLTVGQSEFSVARRQLWNTYNRKKIFMYCFDTTDSWTYTLAAFRAANANKTDGVGRVSCCIGKADVEFRVDNVNISQNTGANKVAAGGVGIDSQTVSSAQIYGIVMGTADSYVAHTAYYEGWPAVGGHWIQRLELSEAVGTTKWGGDVNSPGQILIGMIVEFEG